MRCSPPSPRGVSHCWRSPPSTAAREPPSRPACCSALCVYLSYGLVLLGILAVAVLIVGRTWRPLPWALAGAAVVAAAFTAAGFEWWEAYPVLHERYYAGIASERPYSYWVWADVAAWTFTVGLVVWAAFPRAVRAFRDGDVTGPARRGRAC